MPTSTSSAARPICPSNYPFHDITTWRANVTPVVAAYLSHFGVPSARFRVLAIDGTDAEPVTEGFAKHLIFLSPSIAIQTGDIVVLAGTASSEARLQRSARKQKEKAAQESILVRVEQIQGEGMYQGVILIYASSIWGRAVSQSELYQTDRLIAFTSETVIGSIDPHSLTLRFRHDEKDCSWTRLDSLVQPATVLVSPQIRGRTIILRGTEYHEHDCLLLQPRDATSTLLEIAQIQAVESDMQGSTRLVLRPFARVLPACPASALQSQAFRDPHQLILMSSDRAAMYEESRHLIVRKCTVIKSCHGLGIPNQVEHDDHFWTASPDYVPCQLCNKRRKVEQNAAERIMQHSLRTMDLFAGAGGLSIGLALAGNIKTKWAVEMDSEKAKTLQGSHPNAQVYVADASQLLEEAVNVTQSEETVSSRSRSLPSRGQVDLLVAGPPCQSFSKLNSNRVSGDDRSLLVAVTLAWIEALLPDHAIIENVGGIMDNETLKLGFVNQGFPKLIVLSLLSLNYSVRIANVEASAYGTPQERRRIIFIAARQGLPQLPPPSHVVSHSAMSRSESINLWPGHGRSPRVFLSPDGLRGCAALPGITVMDAIDDLPAFDWKDPHETYPLRPSSISSLDREKEARKRHIPSLDAVRSRDSTVVGMMEQVYGTEPRTPYQVLLRQGCGPMVSQHQTPRYGVDIVERVTNVLFNPRANWRSWTCPQVRKPLLTPRWATHTISRQLKGEEAGGEHRLDCTYQRLDAQKPFVVSLTTASPNNRQGAVIHPTQARVLTLRESARAQGFPDWLTWHCSLEEAQRQIGNAVPVPLARMLGRAIIANVVEVERRKEQLRQELRLARGPRR